MNMRLCQRAGWIFLTIMWGCGLEMAARADTASNIASLFAPLNGPHAAGRPRLPSIILIECDSVGYLDLSCYGQKQFETPNLDRLAAGGMLFTNYDAQGGEAAATRAALLLGHAVAPIPATLPASAPDVAQILKTAGYHTCYLGEWDFGGEGSGSAPWEKGFDEFAGYFTPEEAEDYYPQYVWHYAPHAILNETNGQWEAFAGKEKLMANSGKLRKLYLPDLYGQAALNFIRSYQPDAANHHRPFFLWINFPTPHPSPAAAARTGNSLPVPTDAPYSEQNWPQVEKNKAAMISRLDTSVGGILDFLAKQGLTNTVAVFFSSAALPRAGGGLDPMFFPSVTSTNDVRLPMIASWPNHIPAGRVSGFHWTPADFLSTAAELAIMPYRTNEVGRSALSVLYGRPQTNAPASN